MTLSGDNTIQAVKTLSVLTGGVQMKLEHDGGDYISVSSNTF